MDCLIFLSIECLFAKLYVSYCKFMYWSCFGFMLSNNQLQLMIYCTIEVDRLNFKTNIQPHNHIGCIPMKYFVMLTLIIQVICTIELFLYFMDIYTLRERDNVVQTNCTNLQSIYLQSWSKFAMEYWIDLSHGENIYQL